jgi:hypothetical protein
MILYILIGVVVASFVIAYFSARTWHWGYVILVEALILATFGFFLLAAETLRINAVLRTQVKGIQKQIDTVDLQNAALAEGSSDGGIIGQLGNLDPPVKVTKDKEGNDKLDSLTDLDHRLLIITRERGRVWRNVKPAGQINAQTGAVSVSIPAPIPANLKAETVVYLFGEGAPQPPAAGVPRGPQFLGEFTVAQVGPQTATLQPVSKMDEFELRRLAASPAPWIIYDSMPIDRHQTFAGKPDPELKQKLPAKTVNEYLRDGKPSTADEEKTDPIRVIGFDADGKQLPPAEMAKATKKLYQRRLRDYAAEFDDLSRRRVVMLSDIDAINKDIERLKIAQEVAKKVQAFREDERAKLTSDLAGVTKEQAAIEQLVGQIKKQIARANQLTQDLLLRNTQMADQLSTRQLEPRAPAGGATSPAKTSGPLALERR